MKNKLLTILLSVFMIITAFTTNVFADGVSVLNFTITPITKDSLSNLPENNIESASPEGKCEAITFSFHLFNVNNEKIAYHDEGGWKKADGNPYEGTPDFSSVDYVIEEIKFGSVEDSFAETMTIKVNGGKALDKLSEGALHTGVEGYFVKSDELDKLVELVINIKFSVVTKVAKIGDTEYTTFEDAVNYLNNNGSKGTIVLLENCAANNDLNFGKSTDAEVNMVIDMNSHTLTLGKSKSNTIYGSIEFKNGTIVYPEVDMEPSSTRPYKNIFTTNGGNTTGSQSFKFNNIVFNVDSFYGTAIFNPYTNWTGTMEFIGSTVTIGEGLSTATNSTILFGNVDNGKSNATIKLINSNFEAKDLGYTFCSVGNDVYLENSSLTVGNIRTYFSNGGYYTYHMKNSDILIKGNNSTKTYRVCNYLRLDMDGDSSFIQKKGTAAGAYFWGESIIPSGAKVEFASGSNKDLKGYARALTTTAESGLPAETKIVLESGSEFIANGQIYDKGEFIVKEGASLKVTGDITTAAMDSYTKSIFTVGPGANVFSKGILTKSGGALSLASGYYKNNPSSFVAEGYETITLTNDDPYYSDGYKYRIVKIEVAQIGNTTYPSLEKAVIAAQDGDTIKLLKDIELSSPVRLDKAGTFVIDGDGHTIKPATEASFGADGCLCFGKSGGWDSSEIAQKIFTIKNTTFSGFTTGINDVIRAEGSTLTIDKCTFKDNTVTGARSKSVVLLTGVDAKVINSTFTNNTAGLCIDFNTQGGSANPNTPSNIKVDNCYFNGNNLTGNGVMYLYGPKGSITNNTFEENTVTEDGAAVIYLSGKADRIANNLFKGNTIKANGSGKLGVIAFGSSSTGTALEENAFVGNTLNKNGQAPTSGTAYVGADSISVERNYWGDGQAPEIGDEKDIYTTKGTTFNEYATAYTLKKPNSWGVNVTISEKIAKYGSAVYTSYDSAKAAAPLNKFGTGWYFNVNPSADLADNCIAVASDDSDWLFKVVAKAVDIDPNTKTDVEPGQKEAKAPTGETPEAQAAKEAAQVINNVDKTLGGVKDLQPDAESKLNDSSVVNSQLENNAKTALTNDTAIKYDASKDTLMLVIEPYFDVETKTAKKESSKITSITYEIDAKYNILATTAATTEQIIKEGIGKNTVIVETNKDLSVNRKVVLSIPLPNEFGAENGDRVYIKHTHGSQVYYYDAIIVVNAGQKYVTFKNPNGFSTFEIMLERPTPTPTPEPKPRYIVPNTGVE